MLINIAKITVQLEKNDIEALDFSYHRLELTALQILARALQQNSSLKVLNLKLTGLNMRGLSILGEAIKTHPSLMRLDLSNNYLGTGGVDKLVEIIKENRSIQYLYLTNSGHKHKEIMKIAAAIKENPILLSVCLDDENFNENLIATSYGLDLFEIELRHSINITIDIEEQTLRSQQLKLIEDYLCRNKNKLNNDIVLLAIILAQGMRQTSSFFRKRNIPLEVISMIFEHFDSSLFRKEQLINKETILNTVMNDLVAHRFNKSFCAFFKKPLVWCEKAPLNPQPKPRVAKVDAKPCCLI